MKTVEMIALAVAAANEAGDRWMEQATNKYAIQGGPNTYYMLDLCCVRKTGSGVIELNHEYRHRQEIGLKEACANAAKQKLEEFGVTGLTIWSYID